MVANGSFIGRLSPKIEEPFLGTEECLKPRSQISPNGNEFQLLFFLLCVTVTMNLLQTEIQVVLQIVL